MFIVKAEGPEVDLYKIAGLMLNIGHGQTYFENGKLVETFKPFEIDVGHAYISPVAARGCIIIPTKLYDEQNDMFVRALTMVLAELEKKLSERIDTRTYLSPTGFYTIECVRKTPVIKVSTSDDLFKDQDGFTQLWLVLPISEISTVRKSLVSAIYYDYDDALLSPEELAEKPLCGCPIDPNTMEHIADCMQTIRRHNVVNLPRGLLHKYIGPDFYVIFDDLIMVFREHERFTRVCSSIGPYQLADQIRVMTTNNYHNVRVFKRDIGPKIGVEIPDSQLYGLGPDFVGPYGDIVTPYIDGLTITCQKEGCKYKHINFGYMTIDDRKIILCGRCGSEYMRNERNKVLAIRIFNPTIAYNRLTTVADVELQLQYNARVHTFILSHNTRVRVYETDDYVCVPNIIDCWPILRLPMFVNKRIVIGEDHGAEYQMHVEVPIEMAGNIVTTYQPHKITKA